MDRRQFLRLASAAAGLGLTGCLDGPWTGDERRSGPTAELTPAPVPETETFTPTPEARRYRPGEQHTMITGTETIVVDSIAFTVVEWTTSPTIRVYEASTGKVYDRSPPKPRNLWFQVTATVGNLRDEPLAGPELDTFTLFSSWRKHNPVITPPNVPSWEALRENGTENPIRPPTTSEEMQPIPPGESARIDLLYIIPSEDRLFLRWRVADSYDVRESPIYVELRGGSG